MPNILKCDDCGNRFDARDKRGSARTRRGETSTCPLCRALRPMFGYSWAVKNDCNGIFETYSTRRAAQDALAAEYAGEGLGCYVVPAVVLEVPDDGMLRIYANYAADDLEKYDGVDTDATAHIEDAPKPERKKNRVKLTLEFEVDLDMVPGFGHRPDDWKPFAVDALTRQIPHYNPTVKVIKGELKCIDGIDMPIRYLNDADAPPAERRTA